MTIPSTAHRPFAKPLDSTIMYIDEQQHGNMLERLTLTDETRSSDL